MAFTIDGVSVTVEGALDNSPFETVSSWTDLSDDVKSISISRGRQHELAEFQTGTATLKLRNTNQQYNPLNTASPYYDSSIGRSKIEPGKRIRIKAVYDSSTYYLYDGYIATIPQGFLLQGADGVAEFRLVDAFKYFNLNNIIDRNWKLGESKLGQTTRLAYIDEVELSSTRINRLLNSFGWPTARRNIKTGDHQVISQSTDQTYLNAFGDVETAEQGFLFMGPGSDGFIVNFYDRFYLAREQGSSNCTFGNGSGELPFTDVLINFDDSKIINISNITRSGGTTQTTNNIDSIDRFGPYSESKTTINTTDADALSISLQRVSSFKTPGVRVQQIIINPQSDSNIWTHALGRDLLDRITVKIPLSSGTLERDLFIEGIDHDIDSTSNRWTWQLRTSPTSEVGQWVFPAELGVSTILSW